MKHLATTKETPIPQRPASYPRRVLLAVSGLSPQIVTETLYALALDGEANFVPTEIHLITTLEGAQRAELSLLSADLGWFQKLCVDYQLPAIKFDRNNIHVMDDSSGKAMDDIRSVADNSAAADFITAKVRGFTADPDCAMHVSIAGGRKTMGFYLGYALSLYGRAQDRLSHVLVSEPFENSMNFFYPSPYSRVLETRDGKLADTATAKVTLAEIPFVSLRNDLPRELLSGRASFSQTVEAARMALATPELMIDLRGKRIRASGKVIAIPPAGLALLAVFARNTKNDLVGLAAPVKGVLDTEWSERYLDEYRRIVPKMANIDRTEKTLLHGMEDSHFSQHKTKLHSLLEAALGPASGAYFIFGSEGKQRTFRLSLAPDSIHFVESAAFDQEIALSNSAQKLKAPTP